MILGKKSGTDWVLPKIIGSGRVLGTRQALDKTKDYHAPSILGVFCVLAMQFSAMY